MSLYWGKKTGPTGEYGQIVRITEKKGNILGIDMKLGLEIPGDEPPRAKNVDLIHDVGVEDLKVYRVSLGEKDQDQIRNIIYENVFNGYLRRVESDHSYGWHIAVVGSRNVVLSENYIHDGWATGGGRAYGINMRMTSTQCLAVNNVLEKCRHHLNFGRGTNHCIFAYNKCDGRLSHDNYILFHGSHNNHNLVEGNWATGNIVIDGWHHQEGKNNWYFRNFTTTEVGDRARHVKSPRTCIVQQKYAVGRTQGELPDPCVTLPQHQARFCGKMASLWSSYEHGGLTPNIQTEATTWPSEEAERLDIHYR